MSYMRLPCAEFPNDNPGLHAGAIWFCSEVVGAPGYERPIVLEAVVAVVIEPEEPATLRAPPVFDSVEDADDIEIVDDLSFDDAIDESSAPPPPAFEALELE